MEKMLFSREKHTLRGAVALSGKFTNECEGHTCYSRVKYMRHASKKSVNFITCESEIVCE